MLPAAGGTATMGDFAMGNEAFEHILNRVLEFLITSPSDLSDFSLLSLF